MAAGKRADNVQLRAWPKFDILKTAAVSCTSTLQAKGKRNIYFISILPVTESNLRCDILWNRTLATKEPRVGMRYCSSAAFWLERKNFLLLKRGLKEGEEERFLWQLCSCKRIRIWVTYHCLLLLQNS